MRPVRVFMNAAGFSQWIPIDYVEAWFGIGVAVVLSEDANLTYSVQHTYDYETINPQSTANDLVAGDNRITISRAGTVATVTDPGPYGLGHGLTTGDSIIIRGSGSSNLDSPLNPLWGKGDLGLQVASTPSPTTFTYTVVNTGPTADGGFTYIARRRVFTHSTLVGQTARGQGTYNYPVRAIRLYVSAYTAGYADMTLLQGITA